MFQTTNLLIYLCKMTLFDSCLSLEIKSAIRGSDDLNEKWRLSVANFLAMKCMSSPEELLPNGWISLGLAPGTGWQPHPWQVRGGGRTGAGSWVGDRNPRWCSENHRRWGKNIKKTPSRAPSPIDRLLSIQSIWVIPLLLFGGHPSGWWAIPHHGQLSQV